MIRKAGSVSTASPAAPAQDELSTPAPRAAGSCWPPCSGRRWPRSTPPSWASRCRPSARDFHASLSTLQWVVTAYTLTLAGLLLLAGALGDRYGRKKVFLIGVVWFALASVLCGVAPNAPFLIAARAVQGIGAALLTPGSLAILEASFRPDDRSKAIGAWSGLSGVGTAIGPFLGGWLIAAVSWRLIFYINLPLAVRGRGGGLAAPPRVASTRGRPGGSIRRGGAGHARPDRADLRAHQRVGGRLDQAGLDNRADRRRGAARGVHRLGAARAGALAAAEPVLVAPVHRRERVDLRRLRRAGRDLFPAAPPAGAGVTATPPWKRASPCSR